MENNRKNYECEFIIDDPKYLAMQSQEVAYHEGYDDAIENLLDYLKTHYHTNSLGVLVDSEGISTSLEVACATAKNCIKQ